MCGTDDRVPTVRGLLKPPGAGCFMFHTKEAMVPQWKNLAPGSAVLLAAALSVPHLLVAQETGVDAGEAYANQTSPGEVTLSVTPAWEGAVLSFHIPYFRQHALGGSGQPSPR